MPLNEKAGRCLAKTKSGKQCRNPAIKGSDFCRQHAKSRGANFRLNPWRESPEALQLNDPEDKILFASVLETLKGDFELNDSSDRMQVEMAAYYFVKWRQAARDDNVEMLSHYDTLFRKSLKNLNATRENRGEAPTKPLTPAELAVDILEEADKKKREKAVASNNRKGK